VTDNPLTTYPRPPFEAQPQSFPGKTGKMSPEPDHGEASYRGSGKLTEQAALITGGDSGIGRAVAIAFAREGADVAIAYLPEEQADAEAVAGWVEKAGRRALLLPGDLKDPAHGRDLVARTVAAFGRLDVLVNNGAFQQPNQGLDAIEDAVFEDHFRTNVFGPFYVTKAALPHLKPGASVIFTSSVNSKHPMPSLMAYSATKGALSNMVLSLSQLLAEKGIRVNGVLPGPIWTPFIPAGMSEDAVKSFGSQVPFGRPGQPAELASAYVMLASAESSYTSGALVTVAGAMPVL
jgi:NAD(P)-dependent dehydrogenase (short-subunit alcohol dehydrogenase family)